MRASKARTGRSTGYACHRCWLAYGASSPWIPEVGTVCGKAARTDLCGGRPVIGVPTATDASLLWCLGGVAAAWPLAARAQQSERVRRIGVLLPAAANDPEYQARVGAFLQGLALLGWSIGRNVRIDTRWAVGDTDRFRRYAEELVVLAPDVILASSSVAVAALQQATRTAPIVFVAVVDPVGSGFVTSLAHPRGNATGFTNFEYGLSGKWMELLKEIAPTVNSCNGFS